MTAPADPADAPAPLPDLAMDSLVLSTRARAQLELLEAHAPAAARCLSACGRAISYPRGIPAQAAEASGTRINATIGQVTDGRGGAMPMPLVEDLLGGISAEDTVLYAAQGGQKLLREAWQLWQTRGGRLAGMDLSQPVVTGGLTHALSVMAEMFVEPGTRVLLPNPGWGNYDLIFGTRRGVQAERYELLTEEGRLHVAGISRTLAASAVPTVMVVNFPSNPLGYLPSPEEAEALAAALKEAAGPLVVICDDAYLGMRWEADTLRGSFFGLLGGADPARLLPVKVDGATKELFLFGARVGFLTFAAGPEAAAVLEDKARAVLRGNTSSVSAPGQAMVLAALREPGLKAQRDAIRKVLVRRYRALKEALADAGLSHWPFNSGFFALLEAPDPEAVRQELLAQGLGVVAIEGVGGVRIGYGSLDEADIPELVEALRRAIP